MESRNSLLLAEAWPLSQLLQDGREVEITPTLARRILRECESMFQLPEQGRIGFMAGKIRDGSLWNEPLLFGALDGKLIIGDGVDRLAGVDRSGIPVRFLIEVAQVKHREQLRKLVLAALADRRERHAAYYTTPLIEKPALRKQSVPAVARSQSLPLEAPLTEILKQGRQVLVTPELFDRMEAEALYPHERELKEERWQIYVEQIRTGRFRQGSVMSFGLLNGKLTRVDGRNRGYAVKVTGVPQVFLPAIFPVASQGELDDLHAMFDTRASVRTPIEAAGHLVARGVLTRTEVKVLLRAALYLDVDFNLPEMSASAMVAPEKRNDTAQVYYANAAQYFPLIRRAPRAIKDMLCRQAIAAFAIYTFSQHPRKAAEFWGVLASLADEDKGLPSSDPRRALYKRLLQTREEDEVMQLHIVATGWNAFYEGRKLREIRVHRETPFYIAGTPIIDVQLESDECGQN
jgi:hypothetical protein